jgi:predicted flap endonuclease-1-like 5' DNA nuclease
MMKLEEVEGIGPINAEQFRLAGIATGEALLEQGATSSGRAAIEKATGISGTLILKWVNRLDLMRIKGVGAEYSDLLEVAGVDSPAELAQRNAAKLATTFEEVVAARPGTVRRVPTEAEVAGWIAEAKDLPKVVSH